MLPASASGAERTNLGLQRYFLLQRWKSALGRCERKATIRLAHILATNYITRRVSLPTDAHLQKTKIKLNHKILDWRMDPQCVIQEQVEQRERTLVCRGIPWFSVGSLLSGAVSGWHTSVQHISWPPNT